jgi:flagellar biosynthesis protein FlhA
VSDNNNNTDLKSVLSNTDFLIAAGLIGILVVMVIPLPTTFLDLLLSLSISASILILLLSVYTLKPLDFSVFPSILLISTLYRLSLNVATTRRILMDGHMGVESAGSIIKSFGSFVVGGNYVVGAVVFLILVIVNFVVITKGAGRVAEVAARFTLDAMPGKQMSIDADLSAGLISEDEARKRRRSIEMEADFYGAMDGASKFVRGDAIASILITLINIFGGFAIGVFQRDLPAGMAAQSYTLLTIGDGLISQIPALIISTAAGIVVTRTSTGANLGRDIGQQIATNPKSLIVSSAVVSALGLLPGLPFFPFAVLGATLGAWAYSISAKQKRAEEMKRKMEMDTSLRPQSEKIESYLPLDTLELEVGYGLIPIVDSDQNGELLERITSIRKQFATDLGIIVPPLHIRDNLQLKQGEYAISIRGNRIAQGSLMPDHYMAMDPGGIADEIDGIKTVEPAFGLPALWINENQKDDAQLYGYTVVDLPTIIATHLTEIVRLNAFEFLGRQEAQNLIDQVKEVYPKLVEDLLGTGKLTNLGVVVRVLKNLLREQVPIRDLRTILETIADNCQHCPDPDLLTEHVRKSLSRTITKRLQGEGDDIPLISIDRDIENALAASIQQTDQGPQLIIDPTYAKQILESLNAQIENAVNSGYQATVLCSPAIRHHFRKLTERFFPHLSVVSHNEISTNVRINNIGIVELSAMAA